MVGYHSLYPRGAATSNVASPREWLESWVGELKEMGRILGMGAAIELPPIPGVDEELHRIPQRLEGARGTAWAVPQPREVVAEGGVVALHRVRLALIGERFMLGSASCWPG